MIALSALDPPALAAEAAALLRAAGIDTARLDARILVAAVTGLDTAEVSVAGRTLVTAGQRHDLARLLARRLAHEPVSRILGKREFWSLDFHLSPATLDPRPDSETLVEAILRDLDRRAISRSAALSLLDLGAGTGCLSLALLSELPQATALAIDRAEQAARTARRNAASLGLAERFCVSVGDWGGAVKGPFDVILSNPPYIPTGDLARLPLAVGYDPVLALDGGTDGFDAYRRIVAQAFYLLKPKGLAAFEIGLGQASKLSDLLRQCGFCVMAPIRDLGKRERVVIAHRQ